MIHILFVCHGNICRSPMAEFVMRDLIAKSGLGSRISVSSAATSAEELGNPVHPGARRKLAQANISCKGKTARQINMADYEAFDLIIGMDESNLRAMRRLWGADSQGKVTKLLSHCGEQRDVADPWYTGRFDETYADVLRGCEALLQTLCRENGWKV